MMSTMGKDISPYGKSTSSSFKFLWSEDGLCRADGCYRLVFGCHCLLEISWAKPSRSVTSEVRYAGSRMLSGRGEAAYKKAKECIMHCEESWLPSFLD
jgi:hypothetical protein